MVDHSLQRYFSFEVEVILIEVNHFNFKVLFQFLNLILKKWFQSSVQQV